MFQILHALLGEPAHIIQVVCVQTTHQCVIQTELKASAIVLFAESSNGSIVYLYASSAVILAKLSDRSRLPP